MQRCAFCEYENEDGALYCEQCKQDLAPTSDPPVIETFDVNSHLENQAESTQSFDVSESEGPEVPLVGAEQEPGESTPDTERGGAITEPVSEDLDSEPETEPSAPPTEPIRSMQPKLEPEEPTETPAPSAGQSRPKLVVLRGERLNVEYVLYDGANYLGRTDDKPVDIDLEDQEPPDQIWTSRQHAVIFLEEGKLLIEDLNSLNGTFVNRSRIYAGQRTELRDQDVIQVGKVQMRVALT